MKCGIQYEMDTEKLYGYCTLLTAGVQCIKSPRMAALRLHWPTNRIYGMIL